jgi:vacuolar-type H+-ATPase subunit E/Vma4
MNKAKEALKAELLEMYSQALDEMLEGCPEQADFTVLEEQVEKLAQKTLPETLSNLAQERGIFPPELRLLWREAAKEW